VVEEGSQNHRSLFQVLAHSVVEVIEIGVVGTAAVVESVLDKLKSGKADVVEG
jgi:hypothetical protein